MITLHSAKGLEFPVVFITGVEEGLLPVSRAIENETVDPNAIEEERRLFYVGITRAEKLLYLTHTASRSRYGRYEMSVPSRFLENLPVETVRSEGRRAVSGSSLIARSRGWKSLPGGKGPEPTIRTNTVVPDWVSANNAPAAPPPPAVEFRTGLRVFHPKFGEGEISEISERRDDQELVIAFKLHGTKRLLASLARLDVIE